jgi:hypothetical protein
MNWHRRRRSNSKPNLKNPVELAAVAQWLQRRNTKTNLRVLGRRRKKNTISNLKGLEAGGGRRRRNAKPNLKSLEAKEKECQNESKTPKEKEK